MQMHTSKKGNIDSPNGLIQNKIDVNIIISGNEMSPFLMGEFCIDKYSK